MVLGHFCTGVTVITTLDADGPAGFTCQSFAAVSLDPPLVLFCPSRSSATWRRIERTRYFCANVLADGQRELARVFASSAAGRFDGVGWSPAPAGTPVLDGALVWRPPPCRRCAEAGDHQVVIGRVTRLSARRAGPALLFYRGAGKDSTLAAPMTGRRRWSTRCSPGPATPTGSSVLPSST